MIEHALDVPRSALWAGMGLGKTVATLSALNTLALTEAAPALVLGPLRVVRSTWPDEAAKWSHLRDVQVVPVVGTPAERAAALKRPGNVYATNYDNLPWLVEHLGARWPFGHVVADESTRLKGFRLSGGGVRTRALGRVAHKRVARWTNLTGTPAPNGLADLWGQSWFLDSGQRLGRTFGGFQERWFVPRPRGEYVDWQPRACAQAEINAALSDICLSLEARDYFDLPELVESQIRVDLPPKARRVYDTLEREMFASFEGGGELEAFNAAALTLKCLQLANGAAYLDPGADSDDHKAGRRWVEVHDAKLAALDSVLAEFSGESVLVAYHFKSDLARLLDAYPKGRELDHDPQTIRDWNAGKIPILFAHPESAGHGLNLQDGGRVLVYFGHWWAYEARAQILERIGPTRQAQSGHPRVVYSISIVAADTVDDDVIGSHSTKAGVNAALMQGAKRAR